MCVCMCAYDAHKLARVVFGYLLALPNRCSRNEYTCIILQLSLRHSLGFILLNIFENRIVTAVSMICTCRISDHSA